MNFKRISSILIFISFALCALASLWVYESFDAESIDSITNSPGGGSGWHTDSVWSLTNTSAEATITIDIAENLSMGRLVTTGAALRIANPNWSTGALRRKIDITPPPRRGSFWTSYLVGYEGPDRSGTYQHQRFGWFFRKAVNNDYTFASIMIHSGDWESTLLVGADANGKDLTRTDWLAPPIDETVYLVVTAVTNIFLPVWSGSEATTLRQWVLDKDDFTTVVDSGLFETSTSEYDFMQLLDLNCRAVVEEHAWGGYGTGNLEADNVWEFSVDLRNYGPPDANYILDELRLGSSFLDVLPLLPPPPDATTIILR